METLIKLITEHTQELKAQYLKQTEKWSRARYSSLKIINGWNEEDWCKHFRLTPRICNPGSTTEFLGMPTGFYNTKQSREMDRMRNEAKWAVKEGRNALIEKNINAAKRHYSSSVLKLAERLVKKGIKENRSHELKIESGRVGINFEIIIELDGIRVRAWTIIAQGPVQRPHYRYLVK